MQTLPIQTAYLRDDPNNLVAFIGATSGERLVLNHPKAGRFVLPEAESVRLPVPTGRRVYVWTEPEAVVILFADATGDQPRMLAGTDWMALYPCNDMEGLLIGFAGRGLPSFLPEVQAALAA